MAKVKAHGIDGPTLQWIKNWLTNRTQRVVVNGKFSDWKPVTSGVPQGSILGPVLFIIFINDLEDELDGSLTIIKKFADDTKLGQHISTVNDRDILQNCLDKLERWGERWGMDFKTSKCHVLHLGRTNPQYSYYLNGTRLTSVTEERDIGVLVTGNLKPGRQCEWAARTANGVLSQVLRAFSYRDKTVLPRIYKTYVRPHLEFASPAWNPWQKGDVEALEKVQRRFVGSIQGLHGSSYEEK